MNQGMANEYDSNKYLETYLPIPDYYPSGYYAITMMNSLIRLEILQILTL